MWFARILTLDPKNFPGILGESVIGRALKLGIWNITSDDIRNYSSCKHKKVDDRTYGGGNGMILRADVVGNAIENFFDSKNKKMPIIYPSPRGYKFSQKMALEFSKMDGLQLLCGRFEGIDERVLEYYEIIEVSIGDYIISSGDIAAIVIIDTVVRLLDRTFEKDDNTCSYPNLEESFSLSYKDNNKLLEYPQYTKPNEWNGLKVPDILISGNHAKIKKWRMEMALKKTFDIRPDLLSNNNI